MIQTGPIGVQGTRPLPQGKHPLDQEQGPPQQSHIHIRSVEPIQGTSEASTPRDEDPGVGLAPGDAEVRILLVVLEQHVEVRLMVLDQIRLKNQRFGFTVGDDEFDFTDLPRHQADPWRKVVTTSEITSDPAAQCLGLSDVEDPVLPIPHQIATGFGRDLLQPPFETVWLCQQWSATGLRRQRGSASVVPTRIGQVQGLSVLDQSGCLHFADKHAVITVQDATDDLALDGADGVLEQRQSQRSFVIGRCIKAAPYAGLGLEEHGGQILLVGTENIEREASAPFDHAVAGAVLADAHHHQRWFKGPLGHPAGGEPVDLITLAHSADEQPMGDLAQEDLLCVGVETHRLSGGFGGNLVMQAFIGSRKCSLSHAGSLSGQF